MSWRAIFLLAVGLAMDAMAASAAQGLRARRIELRDVLSVAFLFGGFQALMPLVGWMVGSRLGPTVAAWDHWIAFGLLGAVGGKMLLEARQPDGPADDAGAPSFEFRVLLLLAVATSIDALAVGVTLPVLGAPFVLSLVTIGVTTAVLSAFGVLLGRRYGAHLGSRLDALGGVLLIGLGTKILVEHLAM